MTASQISDCSHRLSALIRQGIAAGVLPETLNTIEESSLEERVDRILSEIFDLETIAQGCDRSPIGKKLPGAFYVHRQALDTLDVRLRLYEVCARFYGANPQATLIKFALEQPRISYLFYPDFDTDAHPTLRTSIQVDLQTRQVSERDYQHSENPPILHRKETFVPNNYPHYDTFAKLTRQEERLGLLDRTQLIGTLAGWQQCLHEVGVTIEGHDIVWHHDGERPPKPKIERYRAAIVRRDLSRPVRYAWEADLFADGTTFFDYGCGQGGDVQRIAQRGFVSSGWDPHYAPDVPRVHADIVNLGFVINVIEDLRERREALLNAWELTHQVLLVAAQVEIDSRDRGRVAYSDGFITRRRTFQKYYEQEELKSYIDSVLGVDAIPVDLGIYLVFRDEADAESFRASRWRSRSVSPGVRKANKGFETYRQLLAPLMAFVGERGRLPVVEELPDSEELLAEFRSFRRAFAVVLQATDSQEWEAISEKRRQELLIYLALTNFSGRPRFSSFSLTVQQDIKALFGSLKKAFEIADEMLFSVGDLAEISQVCQQSPIGKLTPRSLSIHIDALEHLDPLLRIYEGCASRNIGRLEGATIVKIHTTTPKISYLFYPDFDTNPHPALHIAMQIDLRDLHVRYYEGDRSDNPPILHRKEQLVTPDYPLYNKFAKLTQQEERWGLLDNPQDIHKRQGWLQCLVENCAQLRGHRVYWHQNADPYRIRLLKSAHRQRRKNISSS
jgi:DNA phosphorothioation-associated putative methyltransferase